MREKAAHEIETSSKALQVVMCITLLMTVFFMVLSLKDIMENMNSGTFLGDQTEWVLYCLFYSAIQLFAIITFRIVAKKRSPFIPEVARNIKIIGGIIMFTSPLARWIPGMISFIATDGEAWITIIDGPIVLGMVLGLVFFCLGAIFDYGCVLQQQDDEML